MTIREAPGDIHRNKFISPTVRIMKPQKQSLNIYKVIQRPTEIKRTKEEGTEGWPSPKSTAEPRSSAAQARAKEKGGDHKSSIGEERDRGNLYEATGKALRRSWQ